MDTTPMVLALAGDVAGAAEEAGVEDADGGLRLATAPGQDCQEDGDGCIPMAMDTELQHMATVLHRPIIRGTIHRLPTEHIRPMGSLLSPTLQMKRAFWRMKLRA